MLGFGDRRTARAARQRRRLGWVIATVTSLAAAGLAACSSSSSSSLPPTTGVLIRAETLTAGRGCGEDPTQLFKYVVVVFGYGDPAMGDAGGPDPTARSSYGVPVTSNVFDCFTDGVFISLPPQNGSSTFRLEVYAYNELAYEASRATIEDVAASADDLHGTSPTWTTECMATQQQKVQALATCDPLAPGLSGLGGAAATTRISLATARFTLPDGQRATCSRSAPLEDGGVDAGSDPVSDAGDASMQPEGGAPLTFSTVRVRPRINATIAGPSVDVPCPTAYVADVAPEPVRYELDVALLDSAGALVDVGAQTICTVTSVPGATTSALCR